MTSYTEAHKKYYRKNRGKIRMANRAYKKEYNKLYAERNKERLAQYHYDYNERRRRLKNKEIINSLFTNIQESVKD